MRLLYVETKHETQDTRRETRDARRETQDTRHETRDTRREHRVSTGSNQSRDADAAYYCHLGVVIAIRQMVGLPKW